MPGATGEDVVPLAEALNKGLGDGDGAGDDLL